MSVKWFKGLKHKQTHIYGPKAISLGSLTEPEQLWKCPLLLLPVGGLVMQLQNIFNFHLNLLLVCLFFKMCGHFFWNQRQSSYNIGSNSFLLRDLLRRRAVGSSGERRAGGSHSRPTAFTTLRDKKWCLLDWNQCSGEPDNKRVCTCVLISSGMVFCWIQEWTSASSSLCSWVNQGWRGWSTRRVSLSFAKTSFWSLDQIQNKEMQQNKLFHQQHYFRFWSPPPPIVGQKQGDSCSSYLVWIWYVIMTWSGVCWIMFHREFSTWVSKSRWCSVDASWLLRALRDVSDESLLAKYLLLLLLPVSQRAVH